MSQQQINFIWTKAADNYLIDYKYLTRIISKILILVMLLNVMM